MDTNYVAADQMGRRVAPMLVKQGWGRIINVTTKLDTMNRPGSVPYGSSKAALEMTTEIWAKELAGTGVTVNIVNPGAGANTPGMAQEMRDWSREGTQAPAGGAGRNGASVALRRFASGRQGQRLSFRCADLGRFPAAARGGQAQRPPGRIRAAPTG